MSWTPSFIDSITGVYRDITGQQPGKSPSEMLPEGGNVQAYPWGPGGPLEGLFANASSQYGGVDPRNFNLPGYGDIQSRYSGYLGGVDQRQAPQIGSLESLDYPQMMGAPPPASVSGGMVPGGGSVYGAAPSSGATRPPPPPGSQPTIPGIAGMTASQYGSSWAGGVPTREPGYPTATPAGGAVSTREPGYPTATPTGVPRPMGGIQPSPGAPGGGTQSQPFGGRTFRTDQQGITGYLQGYGASGGPQSGFRSDQQDVLSQLGAYGAGPQSSFRGNQGELAGMLMRRAQGLDSVAEGQLRQGLDMSNQAQRSMMASARPSNAGMAMRLGMQNMATSNMGLTGQAAQARAMEARDASMGLGSVLGQARGQDNEDYQRALSAMGMRGQFAQGARGQDNEDYQRALSAMGMAGQFAGQARGQDEARLLSQAEMQQRQMAMNDQQRAELLRQSLMAAGMQQGGGQGYEQVRAQRYGSSLGVPSTAEKIAGGFFGALPYMVP